MTRLDREVAVKVGDWVYCEFELGQVVSMKGNRITEFSTGIIRHSAHDLSDVIFPLSMEIKLISDTYEYWMNRLHEDHRSGFDMPEIHRWMVRHWVVTCQLEKPDYEKRYGEVKKYCETILADCRRLSTHATGKE